MRFFERPGGFVGVIIPQIVQKEKRQTRKPAAFELSEQKLKTNPYTKLLYHALSVLSIIFSLFPIDVRQYGTRAAISTWHSWSTYRNRAIFRSYLPSGARFITAFICSALSPCNAGGKTMRAAATGSTEPERLRQLSGVAHHYWDVAEKVDFATSLDFAKSFLVVCSACHDILLTAA
jgi:hypothetical protein